MYLRPHRLPRWPGNPQSPVRSLHTSAVLRSTYRGYNMHGTLREWALRMIRKEDLLIASRSDRRRRPHRHQTYTKYIMEIADSYVLNELRKKERNDAAPKGRQARLVRAADALISGAGNPFEAQGRKEGTRVVRDRTGRLREALRLYMRAAQRLDGSMPVIGSRVWGTTHFLERRILKTTHKLDTAEKVARVHYTPVKKDSVNWGVRARPREVKEAERDLLEWVGAGPPKDVRPSARGLAYKAEPQLPRLHRLAPSAVERARMPLLQAFPGIGNVGGHVLSLGHAFYASRGLLGTPPPPSSSVSSRSASAEVAATPGEPRPFQTHPSSYSVPVPAPNDTNSPSASSLLSSPTSTPTPPPAPTTPPTAFDHAGAPRPYYTYPGHSDSDESGQGQFNAAPDPTAVRGPPWTRRGKMLRWMRDRKKNELLALRYFPAPHPPAPGPPVEGSAVAMSAAEGREEELVVGFDGEGGGRAQRGAVNRTRSAPELALVRQPPPRTGTGTGTGTSTPSLAHALRVRLAGRVRV